MNDVDLIVLVIVAITVCVVLYMLGQQSKNAAAPAQQNFVVQPPINYKTGAPASPYYGEENPINSYNTLLHKTGAYNTLAEGYTTVEDERRGLLKIQGVINPTDEEQHRVYYQSNIGKYPLQIAGDTHEMRSTRSPYVAGTRSMRAVNIGAYEGMVPDKLERTSRPSQ
jgi:hypothetical protein